MSVYKVIERLRKENPELLADVKKEDEIVNIDEAIARVDDMTSPSEFKRLSDAIARRRMTAPGLTKEELVNIMKDIGK